MTDFLFPQVQIATAKIIKMNDSCKSYSLELMKTSPFHKPHHRCHQIFLPPADEGKEDQQQRGVHDQGQDSAVDVDVFLYKKQSYGHGEINESRLQIVRNRRFFLPDEIGQHHAGTITREAAPSTGPVTIFRYKDEVDGQQHRTADGRENGAPQGLVCEFVPKRQVEINAHEDFGHHHDGHHAPELKFTMKIKVKEKQFYFVMA